MTRPDYITEEHRSTVNGVSYVMFRDPHCYDVMLAADYDADDWNTNATAPLAIYEHMLAEMVMTGVFSMWSINTGAHACVSVAFDI